MTPTEINYWKIATWVMVLIAILVMMYSFTRDREEGITYTIIALIIWLSAKGVNMYIVKKEKNKEE